MNSAQKKLMDAFIAKQMLNKKFGLTGADFDGDVVGIYGIKGGKRNELQQQSNNTCG